MAVSRCRRRRVAALRFSWFPARPRPRLRSRRLRMAAGGARRPAEPQRVLVPETPGFYRPLIAVTFAADLAVHGLRARGYGFTNLALLFACVAALWFVCRSLGLSAMGA